MSLPFPPLDPATVLGELANFGARLARVPAALASASSAAATTANGCSERDAVWRDGKTILYRYRPLAAPTVRVPLLIVYALVNRPGMLDLEPDRSLVRRLLERGIDLYLIDWGYPDGGDRLTELVDYLERGIDPCVREVAARHDVDAINLLGVCQGGTLSLCYTALHAERVRNLVTMVTPVDFHTPGNLLAAWARGIDVEALLRAHGNVPGALLNAVFVAMLPFRLGQQKYLNLIDAVDDPEKLATFLRMEKWIFDSPDQAGAAFGQFLRWFYHENRLAQGTLELGGQRVDLARITQPLLNVFATQDHLVPPAASRALQALVGSRDYTALEVDAGHIGLYTSARSQRELPGTLAAWLAAREPRRSTRSRSQRRSSR
jgi:polyhydroxyalkanoate synthase